MNRKSCRWKKGLNWFSRYVLNRWTSRQSVSMVCSCHEIACVYKTSAITFSLWPRLFWQPGLLWEARGRFRTSHLRCTLMLSIMIDTRLLGAKYRFMLPQMFREGETWDDRERQRIQNDSGTGELHSDNLSNVAIWAGKTERTGAKIRGTARECLKIYSIACA